jgi:two-component system cell cycle sensor histidine kinase PleC
MSALAPMADESMADDAPPLQPEAANAATTEEKQHMRHRPIMSAGTGV